MVDQPDNALKVSAQEKKAIKFNNTEISYDKALQLMAEWWETIKSEGINVAAEIQRRRSELKK